METHILRPDDRVEVKLFLVEGRRAFMRKFCSLTVWCALPKFVRSPLFSRHLPSLMECGVDSYASYGCHRDKNGSGLTVDVQFCTRAHEDSKLIIFRAPFVCM